MSVFFFKQKTAYEMRISDWSSDVCSSDLNLQPPRGGDGPKATMSGHQRPCSAELTPRPHLAMRVIQKLVQIRPAVAVRIAPEIGRASCRERVCQYVSISVVAVSLKKKENSEERIVLVYT